MIGFQMSDQQKELVTFVRDLVENKIKPLALEMDARGDESFDWRLVDVLAQNNLIALSIPREYNGRGLDYLTISLIIEEIAAGCAGLAACLVGTMHAVTPIVLGGTEKQKEEFLPLIASPRPALASFALTEPAGGSDLGNLITTAQNKNGCYVLNGAKDYIVNGAVAEYATVCANVKPDYGRVGLQFFIVPGELIKVKKIRKKLGIRYTNTAHLSFADTEIPRDNMISEEGGGYLLLNQTLDCGRAQIGAIMVGIARAAYQIALDHARKRQQFGRPIFSNQGVSFPLVDMATSIEAARFLVWRACWLMDKDEDYTKASSMAKVFASEVAQQVTAKAIDLMGAFGYTTDCLLNVYFRDAKAGSIVEGTNNIQKMITASLL